MEFTVKKSVQNVEKSIMDFKFQEELLYLLKYMDDYIEKCVYNVLSDSQSDPHYSAVTTTNLIKCYVKVMDALDVELPYTDVKSYFKFNLLTANEYMAFEKSREKESHYYRGVQY